MLEKSAKRQTARKQQRSSGRIEVTNIALLPKFVRRSVQGRPRCLQARAPRCTECGLDVYCAIPRRHAPAEGASCRAPPARRCRSSGKWGPKRVNQMTQYSKTRVLVGRGGGILEIPLVTIFWLGSGSESSRFGKSSNFQQTLCSVSV